MNMNRRDVLASLAAIPYIDFFASKRLPTEERKMHLYEIDYASSDQPYIYCAYSREEAIQAYKNDTHEDIADEKVRDIPDDEILVYGEELESGGYVKRRETAREFADQCCHPNCCVLCDAHYC